MDDSGAVLEYCLYEVNKIINKNGIFSVSWNSILLAKSLHKYNVLQVLMYLWEAVKSGWYTPLTLEFKVSLALRATSKPARASQWDTVLDSREGSKANLLRNMVLNLMSDCSVMDQFNCA